jgi:murein DD-endopeptidase MepM/ murein hydrolase activator NlpD
MSPDPRPPVASAPFRVILVLAVVLVGGVVVLQFTGRLDSEGPTVQWVGFDGSQPVGGEIVLRIAAGDASPGVSRVMVRVSDHELAPASQIPPAEFGASEGPAATHEFRIDTRELPDGPHDLTVVAVDGALWRNRTDLVDLLIVDNTPPQLTLISEGASALQGSTLALFVDADEELASLAASFLGREAPLFPVEGFRRYRGLLGIGVEEEPGEVAIELTATDPAGNVGEFEVTATLEDVQWPRGGYIALSASQKKDQQDRDRGKEANDKRGVAYATEQPAQQWDGPFLWPAEGPVTSPFGKFREYSSGVKRHHLGIDIANALGTPVVAPAGGVVTLAEELHIYGNAVILGHGHGLSSSYNHLQTIEVQVGDHVEPGQPIGTMGTTGQSTGSHLHWGMVANGIAVDPAQWTREDLSAP